MCVLQWGRLSDRIGRRPVLCVGLFGLAASMTCFGLSKSFTGLVLSRALSGALNGNIGVMKSMVAEMSDSTNQALAFSMIPIVWIVGATTGPLIGGSLQHPAERWPSVFDTKLWRTYPYLLPCAVAALFPVLGVGIATFILKEVCHFLFLEDDQLILHTRHYPLVCAKQNQPPRKLKRRR